MDDVTRWVLPQVIEDAARSDWSGKVFASANGEQLTYDELAAQAAQVASLLERLGAGKGDHIAVLLPNNLDFIRAWAGIGRLGAVSVLINTELKGTFLEHPLSDCGARLLVIHQAYLDRLAALPSLPQGLTLVVVGECDTGPQHHRFDNWQACPPTKAELPAWSDLACIMYTSGTTGPPKGVLMPHAHCFLFGLGVVENLDVTEADHYYISLPLSHANGLLMQIGAVLIAGASATIREKFSATEWLDDIRQCGATITNTLGAINAFVIGQPPSDRDREHNLRLVFSAPNHPDHVPVWRERFGIRDVATGYGMTEVNIPLYGKYPALSAGACGWVYDRYFEVEIRDPTTDLPVPQGEIGEIMVRPRIPHAFMAGYHGLPDKTVEAWRNFWFHTGDAGRIEPGGAFVFVDRIKDCIRRRGENISAADLETAFASLPGVSEIAAFAVPSDMHGGEDEIMLAVVQQQDRTVAPADILLHAREVLPRFAQPRYLAYLPSLPKTGTEKVRKAELRKQGVTKDTIDLASVRI